MRRSYTLTTGSSLLLDGLRLSAALTVLVYHSHDQWFPSALNLSNLLGKSAHAAVIIFFVLSGYVIAYSTARNNRGVKEYTQARLSRLCSVVIPALIVTAIVECTVKQVDTALYMEYSRGVSWPRYLLSAGFLNEVWFLSAAPPINTPLWSLSFEFWYYIVFGLWFYRGRGWQSYLLPVIACLIAGPKILLMMPIWLLGYVAYRLPKRTFSPFMVWLFVLISLLIAGLVIAYGGIFPFLTGTPPLFFASQFITDWLVGLWIALALWFLPLTTHNAKTPSWIRGFRRIADLTFSIYVLHNPLLILCRALFDYHQADVFQMMQALISVLVISLGIGFLLERQRPYWAQVFRWLFSINSALMVGSPTLKRFIGIMLLFWFWLI